MTELKGGGGLGGGDKGEDGKLAGGGGLGGGSATVGDSQSGKLGSTEQAAGEPPAQTVEEVLAELNSLVGLEAVKSQVTKFLAMQQANLVRKQAGQPTIPLSLHLVFTGDPGTGKTTVARIVGKLYQAAGLLPKGQLIETDRSGLVAGFVGQTALKVNELVEQADGGILFIDEAYSLARSAGEDFGVEAIAALVKAMEDRRETLAVIAAGYKSEMDGFINANPGLRSRFQTFVDFPNYSSNEMLQIFSGLCNEYGIAVQESVSKKLSDHFNSIDSGGTTGNGRYVRAIFESMFASMSMRAADDGTIEHHELLEFHESDIPELQDSNEKKPRIGFA